MGFKKSGLRIGGLGLSSVHGCMQGIFRFQDL